MDQSTSPTPTKIQVADKTPMSFYDALKRVREGETVTKLEWHDNDIYGFLKNEILNIHIEGVDKNWIVSEADMAGVDWVVL